MCGTGYLLGQLSLKRPDLQLFGCSLEPAQYLIFGRDKYPGISLTHADALEFGCPTTPDVAVCTGGIHHLKIQDRDAFVRKVAQDLRIGGWFLVGEPVIEPYATEIERRLAAIMLNTELMRYAVARQAPRELLDTTVNLLRADLFEEGESKLTETALRDLLARHFPVAEFFRVWPKDNQRFGDRLLVCGPSSAGPQTRVQ
jgi:hypothetical protein